MRHELYIDDKLVDLGDANISLNFKSNLLTDISKIVSNNSYTIKLPKTAKNLALIECAGSPFSGTKFPYLNHRGRLLRNGVEIISDANVVLTGVDDSINIALSWGAGSNLQNLIKGDKKLAELSYNVDNVNERVIWKKEERDIFLHIDYGFREGDPNVWYHPVVSARWVLDKISKDSGIKFEIAADRVDMLDKLKIPLLTRNDAGELIKKSTITLPIRRIGSGFGDEQLPYRVAWFFMDMQKHGKYKSHCGKFQTQVLDYQGYEQETSAFKANVSNAKINVKGDLKIRVTSPNGVPDGLCFVLLLRVEYELLSVSPERIQHIYGSEYDMYYHIDNQSDVIIAQDTYVDFAFKGGPSGVVFHNNPSGSVTFSTEVEEVKLRTDNPNEGLFYFVPNLPDIKQLDYIKAIMQMLGLFAIADNKGTIRMVSFDILLQNKSKAIDWTSKFVSAYKHVSPKKIEYSPDNLAQYNMFRYKDNNKLRENYNWEMRIEDETLEKERDAAKLPFTACDERFGLAFIPLYSYNDKGELEYDKTDPRIVIRYGAANIGRFAGLSWQSLLSKYYGSYKQIMTRAKVITEQIRLSDIDLRDIRMDVPVYIGQYGSYFAIIDIKTKGDSICDVKLIKI